jgi:hypothetical protein
VLRSVAGSSVRRPVVVPGPQRVTAPLSRLAQAALRTAELIREEAAVACEQAENTRRRASTSRAVAEAELEEARLHQDPNHAAPRKQRVKLLEDVAKVIDSEAAELDSEAERLLSQAGTAEQRARTDGG